MKNQYRIAIVGMDHIHAMQLFRQFNEYVGDRLEYHEHAYGKGGVSDLRASEFRGNQGN